MRSLMFWCFGLTTFSVAYGQLLTSSDWHEREAAFNGIVNISPLSRANQAKIVDLLRRENQVVVNTLIQSGGNVGVSGKYGEDYSEYYSGVLGAVLEIAKVGNDEALRVAAGGSYYSLSSAVQCIVDRWQVSLPVFLLATPSSGGGIMYQQALEMMGRILGSHRSDLDSDSRLRIEQRIMAGLRDPGPGIRHSAIQAAIDGRFKEALPILKELAERDPASDGSGSAKWYPIRKSAAKAVTKLEQIP